jgi:O-antigen/teichoic acid export membrane protein
LKYKFDSSFAKQTIVSVYKKGLFHLLGANSLILAFGFLSQLFVAWILTPVDIGVIKLLQTYSSIFITIGGFGYNISVLKLCSENRSDGEKNIYTKKGLAYSIVGSAISYSLIAVLVLTNLLSEDKTVNNYMLLFGVGVVPQVTSSVYFSYLQALQKNDRIF